MLSLLFFGQILFISLFQIEVPYQDKLLILILNQLLIFVVQEKPFFVIFLFKLVLFDPKLLEGRKSRNSHNLLRFVQKCRLTRSMNCIMDIT